MDRKRLVSAALVVLLFGAWMIPGLIDRDPWKADEAYSFGLVLNILETGDCVVPTLGGEPFMEKPPVFYLTASAFARLLSPPLELHEAARAACAFYVALTLAFVALSSRELNGPGTGWLAAVLLLGSVGLIHTAHMLITDLSLLAGYAVALYGLCLSLRKPCFAGAICGTGIGIAFLAKGLIGPGFVGLTVMGLPAVFRTWRTRIYLAFLGCCLLAALPWVVSWPVALYRQSPQLFNEWLWDNNFGRFLGTSGLGPEKAPFHFFGVLPYFAWPVLPLALWTLWRGGKSAVRDPNIRLPSLASLVILSVLSLSGEGRELYAIPILVPLALLATRAVDTFGPRFVRGANAGIFGLFSGLALAAWLGWLAQFAGHPAFVLERIRAKVPGFMPSFNGYAFATALLATLAWLLLVVRNNRKNQAVPTHWTAGVALLYLLAMTLWLPVTNSNMTYRHDFAGLADALGHNPGRVASKGLGEPQRAMLHYYAGVKTLREESRGPVDSEWILIQSDSRKPDPPQTLKPRGQMVWEGRHHRELFRLYRRIKRVPEHESSGQ
jgi:4-amino-4-deoxy-L-arabinose transferase-like glycosyltransferase